MRDEPTTLKNVDVFTVAGSIRTDLPVAAIVASYSAQNIAADISSVTLYTVPALGFYRVNVYAVNTAPAGGSDAAPNMYMTYTDDSTGQVIYVATPLNTNTAPVNTTQPIQCVAGSTITFYTSGGTYSTSLRYSIYISVEHI
jgi:hypothetical protein